mmetsp:Transcript_40834/g.130359  ORF Transcript_40834/g.130359 Transcript_40834/m.130359 type:complete len:106 (+) Transcript_40834:102-419(+)
MDFPTPKELHPEADAAKHHPHKHFRQEATDHRKMTAHDGPPKGHFGTHLKDHQDHPELKRFYDWRKAHKDGAEEGQPTAHLGAFAGKIDPEYLHHIVRDMHSGEL